MTEKHLWEYDHPYYCAEGNYFRGGHHERFDSWEHFAQPTSGKFMEEGNLLYDFDADLNFLWRWDWQMADQEDYFDAEGEPYHEDGGQAWEEASATDTLMLFFMAQRKGRNFSAQVTVTEADEHAVREWLQGRAERMRMIWEPLLGSVSHPKGGEVDD